MFPPDEFYTNRTGGRQYQKTTCKKCDNSRPRVSKKRTEKGLRALSISQKKRRHDPKFRAYYTLKATRSSDRSKGRNNDLTVEWIENATANGCIYCGEKEIRVSLDRIDNSRGHTKDNVVAACMRCNYLRRDMPFAAWKVLVPAVRKARERGLFAGWDGFGRKNSVLESELAGCEARLESGA